MQTMSGTVHILWAVAILALLLFGIAQGVRVAGRHLRWAADLTVRSRLALVAVAATAAGLSRIWTGNWLHVLGAAASGTVAAVLVLFWIGPGTSRRS